MEIFYLNCSLSLKCTTIDKVYWNFELIVVFTVMSISAIGLINSFLSLQILTSNKELNTHFFRYLNIFAINSFFVSLNDFSGTLIGIVLNKRYFVIDDCMYMTSYLGNYIFTHVTTCLWVIFYSMAGLLDTFITYNRILLFYPRINFLRNTSVYK